ncbi:MAG TPA: response regulator [Abditibacteriaceae bacterium]|jgi:CheY-like chemotaxis protein
MSKAPARTGSSRFAGKTILLVEDDREIRDMLTLMLKTRFAAQIVTAANGQTALRVAQTRQPDLILLDLMLPLIDGFEVTRFLRAGQDTQHLPIIAISNHCWTFDWTQRALAAGCNACFDKISDLGDLIAMIENILVDLSSQAEK